MSDYCIGIAYGTGTFSKDEKVPYLIVRNLDKWYIENIAKETGYKYYESAYNFMRDGQNQWVIKVRNMHSLPDLSELSNPQDFCRAYIELHGIIDITAAKGKNGNRYYLRLRIYGNEKIVTFINDVLPATKKKIQYIKNRVGENYIGETCAIYYQSKLEILSILKWIDGDIKNKKIWDEWERVVGNKQKN